MYKTLLSVKYLLMEARRIEIYFLLCEGTERQQNDYSSGGTTYDGLRVPKGSSGYKSSSHQKDLRKWHMSENNKTGTEEDTFSLHSLQNG